MLEDLSASNIEDSISHRSDWFIYPGQYQRAGIRGPATFFRLMPISLVHGFSQLWMVPISEGTPRFPHSRKLWLLTFVPLHNLR